jgi:hypothetical protein
MGDERRYNEDEVRAIVERATLQASERSASSSEGLTLAELQAIGQEVGLSPEQIVAAAESLDGSRPEPRRNLLGMPVAVQRTVHLPRLLTEEEWELLLVELRTTFEARGRDGSRGNLREWRNSNLYAYVEPLPDGSRIRLGIAKGNAPIVNGIGVVSGLSAVVMATMLALTGEAATGAAILPIILNGAVSVAAFASNALRLPRWARAREAQMEHVIDRARELIQSDSPALPSPATERD